MRENGKLYLNRLVCARIDQDEQRSFAAVMSHSLSMCLRMRDGGFSRHVLVLNLFITINSLVF